MKIRYSEESLIRIDENKQLNIASQYDSICETETIIYFCQCKYFGSLGALGSLGSFGSFGTFSSLGSLGSFGFFSFGSFCSFGSLGSFGSLDSFENYHNIHDTRRIPRKESSQQTIFPLPDVGRVLRIIVRSH